MPLLKHVKAPKMPQARGLRWIFDHAYADFVHVEDESPSTGQFTGTTKAEIRLALDWLHAVIREKGA